MKTLKSSVKTIYTIALTFHDFLTVFVYASQDKTRYSEEFAHWDLTDTTIGNIKKAWKDICHPWYEYKTKNIQYIVRKLGFDGIENYGYYDENKDLYILSVYDYGDCLNGANFSDLDKSDCLKNLERANRNKK